MAYDRLVFSVHAIRRMFEHDIRETDVRDVLKRGEIIEEHQLDAQAIKRIHMAFCDRRPIHVVAIDDDEMERTQIVTVYEPDLDRWQPGFRQRRTR